MRELLRAVEFGGKKEVRETENVLFIVWNVEKFLLDPCILSIIY